MKSEYNRPYVIVRIKSYLVLLVTLYWKRFQMMGRAMGFILDVNRGYHYKSIGSIVYRERKSRLCHFRFNEYYQTQIHPV